MDPVIYRLSLDMHCDCSGITVHTTRRDTARKILITLTDGGVPYSPAPGCFAMLTARTPLGPLEPVPCTIEGSTILCPLDAALTAVTGETDCQLRLYQQPEDGQTMLLSCPRFTLAVAQPVLDGTEEETLLQPQQNALDVLVGQSAEAVEAAREAVRELQQARENGEFNGYTPVKGVDYFTQQEQAALQLQLARAALKSHRSWQRYFCPGSNLADTDRCVSGKLIYTDGSWKENAAYKTSDYLPLQPGATYVAKHIPYIALYDADKTFLSRINVVNEKAFVLPENAWYGRLCSPYAIGYWQLCLGEALQEYAPYQCRLENVEAAHLLVAPEVEKLLVKRGLRFYPVPAGLEYRPAPLEEAHYDVFRSCRDTLAIDPEGTADPNDAATAAYRAKNALLNLYDAWDALVSAHSDYLEVRTLGLSQPPADNDTEVYPIREIRTKVTEYAGSYQETDADGSKVWREKNQEETIPTILLLVGVHGFEKASVYATYCFIRELATRWQDDPVLTYLRCHVNFRIIPVANPWGFVHNSYLNACKVNLNRAFAWHHKNNGTGREFGGSAPGAQCREATLLTDWINAHKQAALLIDFHTTGMENKQNMVCYHNVLDGNTLAPMKQAALDHIQYIHRFYGRDYGFSPQLLTGFAYLQTTTPAGQSYGYCQSQGVYGQLVEVGCNLPEETELYSPRCMQANTRTLGQWLYLAVQTLAAVNEHQR